RICPVAVVRAEESARAAVGGAVVDGVLRRRRAGAMGGSGLVARRDRDRSSPGRPRQHEPASLLRARRLRARKASGPARRDPAGNDDAPAPAPRFERAGPPRTRGAGGASGGAAVPGVGGARSRRPARGARLEIDAGAAAGPGARRTWSGSPSAGLRRTVRSARGA